MNIKISKLTQHIIVFGLVLSTALVVSLVAKPKSVYAAGGVGAGGSGGCSWDCGAGHYSWFGFSWAKYDTGGPGPTDGFRDGTGWGTVQSTCQSAFATSVYIFTIKNVNGNAMGYDYHDVYDTYYNQPPIGVWWDNNRAITEHRNTAEAAFNDLGNHGVNTGGYAFGSNVGWFCSDFSPPPPPPPPIPKGIIYTSKYYPDSEPNDGADTAEYPAEVNNANVCLTNKWDTQFVCNNSNPYSQSGIWVSDNSYKVSINVPYGYRVSRTNGRPFTCNGSNNTGTCTATGVDVSDGGTTYVDFWLEYFLPKGNSDGVANCVLTGWAFDADKSDQSLYLDLWIDGVAEPQPPLGPSATPPGPGRHYFQADVFRGDVNASYGIGGNHGYSIDVTDPIFGGRYQDGLPHTVDIWPWGVNKAGTEDFNNARVNGMPASFTCPIHPRCGNITTTPGNVEPSQSFTINVSANATAQARPGGIPFTANVNIPGIFTGTLNGTIPQGATSATVSRSPFSIPNIGAYSGSYTLRFPGDLSAGPCPGSITVAARPFFVATNGDISSGFTAGSTTCSAASGWVANNGKLVSWFDTPTGKGAGTMLATLALTQIDGVRSAKLPSNPPIKQLSFANSANPYGGLYGGAISCPKDYYSRHTGNTVSGSIAMPASDVQTPSGTNLTFAGGTLTGGSGTRPVVYVNGNVYITGNVTLNNAGVTDPKQLANFYLVVKGNIYISPGVTRLDGVYIAQGNSQGSVKTGQIYTCAQALAPTTFAPPTPAMVNNSGTGGCRQNVLTVNGAFMADKVNLYRSNGTLFQDTPAEIFNYTPVVWLAPPKSIAPLFTGGTGTPGSGNYEAITTLQPVL